MRLKEWLEIHKNDDYKNVMYTCIEGRYEKDKYGKLFVKRTKINKHINAIDWSKFLECDIVKMKSSETECIDPIYNSKQKISVHYCWLDEDQVKITMKRR